MILNSFIASLVTIIIIHILDFFKEISKSKTTIIINFDDLVDITSIINRGKIYVKNKKDVHISEYVKAHLSEQQPCPGKILLASLLQNEGFKIVYYSLRPESMRLETAAFLNEWSLKGELYMNTRCEENIVFKERILKHIKKKSFKVIKVIDSTLTKEFIYDTIKV